MIIERNSCWSILKIDTFENNLDNEILKKLMI